MTKLNWKENIAFLVLAVIFAEWIIRYITVLFIRKMIGGHAAYIYDTKITAIGVIHHELAHALFALLSGAVVEDISLFNFREKENRELGSVSFRTRGPLICRWYQSIMTSLAPAIMGIVTAGIASYWILKTWDAEHWGIVKEWWVYPVIFAAGCISYHSGPSFQDIKVSIIPISIILIISLFAEPFEYMEQAYGAALIIIGMMAAVIVPVIIIVFVKAFLIKILKVNG